MDNEIEDFENVIADLLDRGYIINTDSFVDALAVKGNSIKTSLKASQFRINEIHFCAGYSGEVVLVFAMTAIKNNVRFISIFSTFNDYGLSIKEIFSKIKDSVKTLFKKRSKQI